MHYLDGFLFARRGGLWGRECQSLLTHFFELTAELGGPLAEEKTEGLSSVLTYMGTEMATTLGLFRLPVGKLVDLQAMFLTFLRR